MPTAYPLLDLTREHLRPLISSIDVHLARPLPVPPTDPTLQSLELPLLPSTTAAILHRGYLTGTVFPNMASTHLPPFLPFTSATIRPVPRHHTMSDISSHLSRTNLSKLPTPPSKPECRNSRSSTISSKVEFLNSNSQRPAQDIPTLPVETMKISFDKRWKNLNGAREISSVESKNSSGMSLIFKKLLVLDQRRCESLILWTMTKSLRPL
jgi:hypothetical protein